MSDDRANTRRWLIWVTVGCGVFLLAAPVEMMTALMMSDAGPSPMISFLVAWALAYPAVLILTPVIGWSLYRSRSYRVARWAAGAPLAWAIVMAVALVIYSS
jgi:hypothetical protein